MRKLLKLRCKLNNHKTFKNRVVPWYSYFSPKVIEFGQFLPQTKNRAFENII